ncbi:hypothetical protein ACRALDRAFT_208312 [Sodiomyces alcalophilus JCM 7366]|uniref:uncharacterized protein n=1 Tax=Sodiomyces alcalophilus JCM 7366 TaxID=591952 RepID=UPI0039B48144
MYSFQSDLIFLLPYRSTSSIYIFNLRRQSTIHVVNLRRQSTSNKIAVGVGVGVACPSIQRN